MRDPLVGKTICELIALAEAHGQPAYRGEQIGEWLYQHSVHSIEDMTSLPMKFRSELAEHYVIGRSRIAAEYQSKDNTLKLLLALNDSERIETVGIPYADRFSCCVSTQVGCPVGCIFCATGQSGYRRNLSTGEIVDQVLTIQDSAQSSKIPIKHGNSRVSHVVFMGMGEPLLNYDATIAALHIMNSEMGISMRHLTISTAGYVPGIRKLLREKLQLTLAVSLHAPTNAQRQKLLPQMAEWTVNDIINTCKDYMQATGRRITFEYCLLQDINDGTHDAKELATVIKDLNCHVNLIPYNAIDGFRFRAPAKEVIRQFRETLENKGITVTQRMQRGATISAACGQLRQRT